MAYRGDSFEPDRIWGTVFIILYALMLAALLLFVFGIGSLFAIGSAREHSVLPAIAGGAFATIFGILLSLAIGVHIYGAIGIRNSRAWGFWVTIGLSVLSLIGSSGGMCLTVLPMVYSILRLAGAYGPKPS